jgi:hypothetical protein
MAPLSRYEGLDFSIKIHKKPFGMKGRKGLNIEKIGKLKPIGSNKRNHGIRDVDSTLFKILVLPTCRYSEICNTMKRTYSVFIQPIRNNSSNITS